MLDIADAALAAADPYRATFRRFSRADSTLFAGDRWYVLSPECRIFVIGAGKATYQIAKAVEEVLGSKIHRGLVICKHGQEGALEHIELRLAHHPTPDAASLDGARATQELLRHVRAGDIVVACFTGGSSSLFVGPAGKINLDDKAEASRVLLTCGANIKEINDVRKHLSTVKGGRLVQPLPPGVRLINLTVSDVIGDAFDYITDPSFPDRSTFADALAVIERYGLWDRLSASVIDHLKRGGAIEETCRADDLAHLDRNDVLLVTGDAACQAAAEAARDQGITPLILSTLFEGESREVGRTLAAIAKQTTIDGHPVAPPCLLIGGGETTVLFADETKDGMGGPNQEFAVAVALEIEGRSDIVALGLDTDGTDGPTPYAGGLVDGTTAAYARARSIDLRAALESHDVAPALSALGDLVITGATGTNVNDLKLILVGSPR